VLLSHVLLLMQAYSVFQGCRGVADIKPTISTSFCRLQSLHRSSTRCSGSSDNPSSATPPDRRRRATRRSTKPVELPAEPLQQLHDPAPTSKARSSSTSSTSSTIAAQRRPRSAAAGGQQDGTAAPDQLAAQTAKQLGSRAQRTSPGRNCRGDAATPTLTAAAAPKAARKRPSHPAQSAQQEDPPNIRYNLSPAVGSYSDLNRCSLNLDEDDGAGTTGSSRNGSSRPNSRAPSTGGNGTQSDPRSDDVHGLVYGATLRFSDSAALRLRRRAMVVWEEVSWEAGTMGVSVGCRRAGGAMLLWRRKGQQAGVRWCTLKEAVRCRCCHPVATQHC
jgi:hypothetical protein